MPTFIASIYYPHLQPVIFSFHQLAVRWYGLAYLTGFALAYLCLRVMIHRGIVRITQDQLLDLIGWLIAGVMVGGRAGWWLFYHRAQPGIIEPWYEPIAVWHGGMSFHGGLTGVAIALAVWSYLAKVPGWNVADGAALVTPIGLCLGRIANFINHELVGRGPTNVPWGVIFPDPAYPFPDKFGIWHYESFARHPSQIYEAILEGPVLLLILWGYRRLLRPREGRIAAAFLIAYGLLRFGVEFTRQPDVQLGFIAFGWLTMGQILSLFLSAVGVAVWVLVGLRRSPVAASAKAEKKMAAKGQKNSKK